jgi:serine/threonine-protein kinase
MKRSGPLLTLLGGLVLALVLLSLNATTGTRATSSSTTNDPPPASASRSPSPTKTSRPPSPTPTPPPDADYAGRTDDDSAAIAVTLRDGKAIAYFCDGRDKESWLEGDVEDDGGMKLTGKDGAELNGTLKGGSVSGTADIGGQEYGFTADRTNKPSGLYRATANVRGAEVDGGWIVLPDGRQVGILKRDGTPSAAPEIDPGTGAVTVDGQKLTARPVTP